MLLIVAWLMAQAAEEPAGTRLSEHLLRAEAAVDRIEACASEDPERLEETHSLLAQRRERLAVAAAELFAEAATPRRPKPKEDADGGCKPRPIAALRALAEAEMDSAQVVVEEALGPERRRGLWLAGLNVCGVQSTEQGDPWPMPELILTLDPRQRAALEEITRGREGGILPIWLDGKLLFAPLVREAITGGTVAISGDADALEAIAAAAKAHC